MLPVQHAENEDDRIADGNSVLTEVTSIGTKFGPWMMVQKRSKLAGKPPNKNNGFDHKWKEKTINKNRLTILWEGEGESMEKVAKPTPMGNVIDKARTNKFV